MCVTLKLKQNRFFPIAGGDGAPIRRQEFVVVSHAGWSTLACPVGWFLLNMVATFDCDSMWGSF